MQNIRSIIKLYLGTALIVSLPLGTAFAGFEWTPPVTHSPVPEMRAVPAPDVNAEILPSMMPLPESTTPPEAVIQETQIIIAPQNINEPVDINEPQTIIETITERSRQTPMPHYRPVLQAAAQPARTAEATDFAIVQGFGSDIPLVLVLNQIVPPAYSYAFDPGIDQGMRITWSGNRPWNDVLQEAVAPHKLTATIIDGIVWIRKDNQPDALSAVTLPMGTMAGKDIHMIPPPATATEAPHNAHDGIGIDTNIYRDMPGNAHNRGIRGMRTMGIPTSGADIAAPIPLSPQTTTADTMPRQLSAHITDDQDFTQSYPRRARPPVDAASNSSHDLSRGFSHDLARPPVASYAQAPQVENSAMPISLMPFKKAEDTATSERTREQARELVREQAQDIQAHSPQTQRPGQRAADRISRRDDVPVPVSPPPVSASVSAKTPAVSLRDTAPSIFEPLSQNNGIAANAPIDNISEPLPPPITPPTIPTAQQNAAPTSQNPTSQNPTSQNNVTASKTAAATPRIGALDPFEIFHWNAKKGENLYDVLTRWSNEANVSLVWSANATYVLLDDIVMHDTFPDAIAKTLGQFSGQNSRPIGKLHPNLPTGPSVLSIETYSVATTQ